MKIALFDGCKKSIGPKKSDFIGFYIFGSGFYNF